MRCVCQMQLLYHIVGNFRLCKFSRIWPKAHRIKFHVFKFHMHARAISDHAHAAHLWPTAHHGDLSLGYESLATVSIE